MLTKNRNWSELCKLTSAHNTNLYNDTSKFVGGVANKSTHIVIFEGITDNLQTRLKCVNSQDCVFMHNFWEANII